MKQHTKEELVKVYTPDNGVIRYADVHKQWQDTDLAQRVIETCVHAWMNKGVMDRLIPDRTYYEKYAVVQGHRDTPLKGSHMMFIGPNALLKEMGVDYTVPDVLALGQTGDALFGKDRVDERIELLRPKAFEPVQAFIASYAKYRVKWLDMDESKGTGSDHISKEILTDMPFLTSMFPEHLKASIAVSSILHSVFILMGAPMTELTLDNEFSTGTWVDEPSTSGALQRSKSEYRLALPRIYASVATDADNHRVSVSNKITEVSS